MAASSKIPHLRSCNSGLSVTKQEKQSFEMTLKLIVVGDSGVGKTNIVRRFCEEPGRLLASEHIPTIGVDFRLKKLLVDDRMIKLQVWDTAGQQRYRNITETYYKGAAGVLIVYAIDSVESFANMEKWVQEVVQKTPQEVQKVIVANKIDLRENGVGKITEKQGLELAMKYNLKYLEISAKNNQGIYQMFYAIAQKLKIKIQEKSMTQSQVERTLTLSKNSNITKYVKNGVEYKVQRQIQIKKDKRCFC